MYFIIRVHQDLWETWHIIYIHEISSDDRGKIIISVVYTLSYLM